MRVAPSPVLAGVVAGVFAVSPAIGQRDAASEDRLADLNKEVKERKAAREASDKLKATRAEFEAQSKGFLALKSELRNLQTEIDRTVAQYEDYRESYRARVRGSAAGLQLKTLETKAGKEYREVTIKSLSKTHMRINHVAGPATIAVPNLPDELVQRFHLDAAEAVAIEEERRRTDGHR